MTILLRLGQSGLVSAYIDAGLFNDHLLHVDQIYTALSLCSGDPGSVVINRNLEQEMPAAGIIPLYTGFVNPGGDK